MPPAAFPLFSVIRPLVADELEPEAPVSKSPDFVDGGGDLNLDADVETRRFTIRYGVLLDSEAAAILAHVRAAKYNSNVGSAYGFQFTTRTGEVLSDVHYDRGGYKHTQENKDCHTIDILLIKRP